HQPPRRPGVEAEALVRPQPRATAEFVVLLDDLDVVAVVCEQRRGGQSGDAAADDDDVFADGHAFAPRAVRGMPRRATAAAAILALPALGTRTRRIRASAADDCRRRSVSSANRSWAAHTATRQLIGSSGITAAA